MTKKDYIAIAEAIRSVFDNISSRQGLRLMPTDVVLSITDALERDNPRFDRKKFLQAALGWVPSDH